MHNIQPLVQYKVYTELFQDVAGHKVGSYHKKGFKFFSGRLVPDQKMIIGPLSNKVSATVSRMRKEYSGCPILALAKMTITLNSETLGFTRH